MGIAIVAILAGLVGAYIVRANLMKEEPPVVEAPPPMTLPLATADLPADRRVEMGDIGLVRLTREEIAERGYDLTKMMASAQQIIGRKLKEPVRQGQPFLTTALYLEGTGPDFTAKLKPGYRAIAMQIPRERGGSLPVGSYVDVIFRSDEQRAQPPNLGIPEVTVPLLDGLEILNVAEPPRNAQNAEPTISLAVTPEQAAILQTTTGNGELTLVARPQDERLVSTGARPKPLSLEDVLGIERPEPQKVFLFATEIYRRGSRSVNVFRDDKLIEQLQGDQAAPPGVDDALPPEAPGAGAPLDPLLPPTPPPPVPMPPLPAPANDDPFRDDPPANPAAPQP
jgi:Flp pilus assembly protein CpaB